MAIHSLLLENRDVFHHISIHTLIVVDVASVHHYYYMYEMGLIQLLPSVEVNTLIYPLGKVILGTEMKITV